MQMCTFDASAFTVPCDSAKNRLENLLRKFSFLSRDEGTALGFIAIHAVLVTGLP